jgi:hypothetical protein
MAETKTIFHEYVADADKSFVIQRNEYPGPFENPYATTVAWTICSSDPDLAIYATGFGPIPIVHYKGKSIRHTRESPTFFNVRITTTDKPYNDILKELDAPRSSPLIIRLPSPDTLAKRLAEQTPREVSKQQVPDPIESPPSSKAPSPTDSIETAESTEDDRPAGGADRGPKRDKSEVRDHPYRRPLGFKPMGAFLPTGTQQRVFQVAGVISRDLRKSGLASRIPRYSPLPEGEEKLDFGKHKGKCFDFVCQRYRGYARWAIREARGKSGNLTMGFLRFAAYAEQFE